MLGPVELRVDGLVAPIERVQVRRLLSLLAVRPCVPWATDALVEELWPGDLPQSPRAAIRVIASRARHALTPHSARLRLTGDAYQLELDPDDVDVGTFDALVAGEPAVEQLEAALGLWRGSPFGGALGPPSLDLELARLQSSRDAARLALVELLTAGGAIDRAVVVLAPLVEERPTDERAAVLLASTLAMGGRRSDAVAVLRRARAALLNDHGLEPGAELTELERTILAAPKSTPPARDAVPSATGRRPCGREREMDGAAAWLADATRRDGARCVLVDGPAGIGKSAVAAAVAEHLDQRTVHVYCDPDGPTGQSLLNAFDVVSTASSGDARGRTIAVVQALVDRVVSEAAEDPLVLVIDDIQWASEVELRFLVQVVRTREARRLSVLATRRDPGPGERDETTQRLTASLAGHDHTLTLRLGPLDAQATRAAYAAWGGRPLTARSASALLTVTGGLPYLIRVLALTGQDPTALDSGVVTDHLGTTIEARLVGLDESAMSVLRVAAVMGRSIDVAVLAATCDVEPIAVASIVDRATGLGVVTLGPHGLQFDHELTRLHLAAGVGPASSLVLHRAAMEASIELGRDAIAVARHVVGAGASCVGADAVARLLAGADEANRRGAFGDAVRFLGRAAELEPDDARRLEFQRRQAWMLECAGDRPAADALIDVVFATAQQRGWTALMARAALAGASLGIVVGGDLRRRSRLQAALASPPDDERLRLDVAAAMIRELNSADEPIPPELWRDVDELAHDDDARAARLGVRLQVALRSPGTAQLVADAREYVVAARQTGHPLNVLEAEENLVRVLLTAGDVTAAEAAAADLRRTVHRHRWPRYVWSVELLEATLTDLHHGAAAADEVAQRALAIGHEHGIDDTLGAYAVFRLSVAAREGGVSEFAPVARTALDVDAPLPAWRAVLAAALADAGDIGGARRQLELFVTSTTAAPKLFHHVGAMFGIRAARTVGDLPMLGRCVDFLLPWSGGLLLVGAGAGCFGPADLALAEGLAALGDARAPALARSGEHLLEVNRAEAWLPRPQGSGQGSGQGPVYGS